MTLTAEVCGFCGGHWLDYRSRSGRFCHATRVTSWGDTVRFHATPYVAHKFKGITTGEPLGLDDYLDRLANEAQEVDR